MRLVVFGLWLSFALACNSVFSIDDLSYGPTTATTTSVAATTTGSGGGIGGDGGAGGGGGVGGAGGDGGSVGGGSAGALIDRGLVARYFITDQDGLDGVADAAPDPLDLEVVDGGNLAFGDVAGHYGITWSAPGGPGGAFAPVAGTKIESALDGSIVATLEVVVELSDALYFERMLHIGLPDTYGNLSLSTIASEDRVNLSVVEVDVARWTAPVVMVGRRVLHVVIDTNQDMEDNRAKLYADGELAPNHQAMMVTPMAQHAPILIDPNATLGLGNRPAGDRSLGGTLHYAAIYAVALSPDEVAANAKRLIVDSDTPP